jgi:hypothetical protein
MTLLDADSPGTGAAPGQRWSSIWSARSRAALDSVDRFTLIVWVVIAAQSLWLGVLMAQGWYYQADLANLAQATGHDLTWSYLSAPQGGHFAAPGRLLFWLLNRVAPLNYSVTILLRLAAQAWATALLARLLVLLIGRRRTVLVVLALYSFSPLLIQGTLWMSASFGLVASQLLLIGALSSHVRHAVSRRTGDAVLTAAFIVGATLLAEEAALTVLALPILSLCFLTTGSTKERVIATLSYWREWLLIAVPMIGYVLYYFSGSASYGTAAHPIGVGDALRVIRVEFTDTVAPGLVGGPWQWFGSGNNYLGLSTPSAPVQTLSVIAVLAVIAFCFVRQGWRALAAWSMPVVIAAAGIVVVAVGRYQVFGIVIAQQFEHGYFVALPAAVAVCLALRGLDVEALRRRVNQPERDPARPLGRPMPNGWRERVLALAALAVLISSLFSSVTYTQLWARSPARSYMTTLEQSLQRAGGKPALYDAAVPTSIIPLESADNLSDVIGLTKASADFGYAARSPALVDGHGHVAPARFYVQTDVDLTGPTFCKFPVRGAAVVTRPLRAAARRNDWYLNVSYFELHASVVKVTLVDRDGSERAPVYGKQALLHSGLGGVHLLFRGSAPVAVRVQSFSPSTSLCIAGAQLGFPYIAKKPGS